jgi:hypothetical protein
MSDFRRSSRVKDMSRAFEPKIVLLLSALKNPIRQPRTRGVSQTNGPRFALRIDVNVGAADVRATIKKNDSIDDVC